MCLDSTARCHSKRPSTASVALAGGASLTVYEVGETTRQDAGCLPYTQYYVQEAVRKLIASEFRHATTGREQITSAGPNHVAALGSGTDITPHSTAHEHSLF